MTRLWRSIEDAVTLHGAEDDWRRRLGTEFESFRRFLIPTDGIVGRLAGDDRGGAWLIEEFDGQCYARCERTMFVREVSRADVVSLQFDMRRLSKEVAAALSLAGGVEIVGSTSHIARAGALPASLKNLPVYVCTHKWTADLVKAVNLVAHHAGGPFLLLHPTGQPIDSQVRSWLSKVDGHTVALKQLIDVTGDGKLAATNRAERLMQQTLGIESADMPVYRFQKDDDFWWIAFDGTPRPVKDSSGMPHIARLLARPHVNVTAMHLEAMASGIHEVAKSGGRGEKVDAPTLESSHARLRQIAGELEQAKEDQDFATAMRLETERDEVRAYVRKATGLNRKIRDDTDAKRAGDSIARAIRRAIKEIDKRVPELADHLRSDLDYGIDCMYSPREPFDWEL